MGYKYDIFISYRRSNETLKWLNDHFIPLLKFRVGMELENEPSIFLDEQLEVGGTWPLTLGDALSNSKIIIPLWSKNYINSQWCITEISHMLEREKITGCRSKHNHYGIIIPIVIHDGENIPVVLQVIQKLEIQECFNVRMHQNSPKAEKLDELLMSIAPDVAKAITDVPPWQKSWGIKVKNELYRLFYEKQKPLKYKKPKFLQ